jgi:hypothetical protein
VRLTSNTFEDQPDELGSRELFTAHEAGHAVLAYYHHEKVGLTTFKSGGGFHQHGPPDGVDEGDHVDPSVERLLAGDIGARLVARMPTNRVSVPLRQANWIVPWTSAESLAYRIHEAGIENKAAGKHDVFKVMTAIITFRGDRLLWRRRWCGWFWRRVAFARDVLSSEAGRRAHRVLSAHFYSCLDGENAEIPADTTLRILKETGAPLRQAPRT